MQQQLTRKRKEDLVETLAGMMDEYPVIGVLDMHSMPARQLQEIKKELVGTAEIKMTRKNLIHLALEQSSRESITDLKENTAIQPALIFSEQNPFSLYKTIQDKKTSAPAAAGAVAPNDIVVDAGMTDLDPGPMLGRIQELGAQTAVEDGKIKITTGSVAVAEGDVINANTAEILNTLGMEPLEVGLDLKLVYEDGEIFGKDVLAIDADEYRGNVRAAASGAFNLAVNAGYVTDDTVVPMLQQVVSQARNLAVNAGVVNEDTVDTLISQGAGHATALEAALDLERVEPEGSESSESEDEADSVAEEDGPAGDEDADTEDATDNDETVETSEGDSSDDDNSEDDMDTTEPADEDGSDEEDENGGEQ